MRFLPVIALVLLCGCAPLDEILFGPPPQDPSPSDPTATTDGDGVSITPERRPVGPPPSGEGWLVRLLREATRSIPWSGPAISLALWLYARLRRRTNQFHAVVQGVDYATHNGDLSKGTLYAAIENAAKALTTLDDFRRTVAEIKARRRTPSEP